MTYTDDALVLASVRFREQDRRVTLLTRNHGRVDSVAISACQTKSKLAGHLQPFRLVSVMMAPGKQFTRVAQAVTQTTFTPVNLERMRLLGSAGRFVLRTTEPGEKDDRIFSALQTLWNTVQAAEENNLIPEFGAGFKNLLEISGYAPEIESCVICQRKEPVVSFRFFSLPLGGVVCGACTPEFPALPYSTEPAKRYGFLRAHAIWRDLL